MELFKKIAYRCKPLRILAKAVSIVCLYLTFEQSKTGRYWKTIKSDVLTNFPDNRAKKIHANLFQINTLKNKKYDCGGLPAFKSQRVGYPANQKLLHLCQHSKNQFNS